MGSREYVEPIEAENKMTIPGLMGGINEEMLAQGNKLSVTEEEERPVCRWP